MKAFIFSLFFLFNIFLAHANPVQTADSERVKINVDLFLSSTCSHCQKANAFFSDIEKQRSWLTVHRFFINNDKAALQQFYERVRQQQPLNFAVPAIFFCDSRWTGFIDENTSGKVLLEALDYCYKKMTQHGKLNQADINVLQKWGAASQFQMDKGVMHSSSLSVPMTALIDAFSPCSLFCFAVFLAFLWLYPTQKWLQFNMGIIFLLSLGVVHYIQQVHSIFYYQILPYLKLPEILIGIALFLTALNVYQRRGHQEKTKIASFLMIVIFTVFAVQIYQQTCLFNVSLVLEQWLTEQAFSPAKRLMYQIIYQIFYLLPLFILLVLYLIFGHYPKKPRYHQALKIAGSFILMAIGFLLVIYPRFLANLILSLVILLTAIMGGWFIISRDTKRESSLDH